MPRNSGWGETEQKNSLNLVEALLSHADESLELDDALKTAVQVEWVSANQLRVTGKERQKTGNRIVDVGTRKEHLVALIEKTGKRLELSKGQGSQQDKELNAIQTVIDRLRDLEVLKEDPNNKKTQGYWKFTLTLQHQTASRDRNLAVVKQKWQEKTASNVPESSPVPDKNIDWHDICGKVLETQQLRRQATTQQYELNIYVPLGLMERPKTPNPRPNPTGEESQPQKEPELQIVQTYKDDAFFLKVIAENRTEKRKQIAIIGEPGAGKTTLLGKLAEHLPKNSPDFPICIRLADLQGSTIKDYLVNNWLEKAVEHINPVPKSVTPEIIEAFKQLFRQGKVWLLLDGVDEMAAESPVQALAKIREQLTDWVGKARVVLSCRLNVWDAAISNTLTDFDTYKTLEFEANDVDEFIRQWFEQASQDEKRRNSGKESFWHSQGKRLQQQLKEPGKDNIRRMVRNPLRLSMLCQSWCVPEPYFPETKAALYKQFTTYFFEWKQEEFQKKHQQVLKETEKKQIKQALGKLALTAMESVNRFRIEQEFAIGQMKEQWFDLAGELGWLVLVDRDTRTKKPIYSFLHSSFQEYFAALAIDDWDFFLPRHHIDKPVLGKPYRIFEPQWKEVILLWLGREEEDREEKEEFIKGIINFNDGFNGKFYWYRAYFLAAAVITEFRSHFADEIAQQIITWSFDCFYKQVGYFSKNLQDAQFHSTIIEGSRAELPKADYPKAVNFILPLLEDKIEYRHIRHEAIKTLGVIGTGNCDAIQALNRIIDDPSEKICCVEIAACSLGKISTENLRLKAIKKIIDLMAIDVHKTAVAYLSQLVFEIVNIPFDIVDLVVEGMAEHIKELDILLSFFPSNWIIAKAFLKIAPIDHPQYQYATDIENITEARIKQVEDSGMDALLNDIMILGLGDITAKELESQILKVISHLNLILRTNQDQEIQKIAGDCLTSILLGQQVSNQAIFLHLIIQGLKDCPDYRIRENYSVLWHCAQNLPYPTFYEAWHDSATTRDPEVPETTADSTPSAQSFNSANLPQVLANAIDNEPDLSNKVKLICIDSHQFIDPENPAPEIYDEMLNQNCPEWQNGYPDTMQKLKLYWNYLRRQSEIPRFFICYDSTALWATPTGFSDSFLKALSKFDGAICVVCEPGDIPLQTFSPQQQDLVAAIVQWIEKVITEN